MDAKQAEPGDGQPEASPDVRSKLRNIALSPATRFIALAVLLLGFAGIVAVYMNVVNRYVHYSVRVQAGQVAEPGASTAMRLTIYRPDTLRDLAGSVQVSRIEGSQAVEPVGGEISSQDLTSFTLPIPESAEAELRYRLDIAVEGEEEARSVEIPLRVQRPDAPAEGVVGLAPRAATEPDTPPVAEERGQIRIARSDPPELPFDVTVVAESSYPVRFLSNRFLLRVTTRQGHPLSNMTVSIHIPEGAGTRTETMRTDFHGLVEFTALPLDVEIWRAEIGDPARDPDEVWLEVVPGFDGLILELPQVLIPNDGRIAMTAATNLTAPEWYYDLHSDLHSAGVWLATGSRSFDRPDHVLEPGPNGWHGTPESLRFGRLQIYTAPFATLPQNSVRGILFKPSGMTDLDAVRQLLLALQQEGFADARYAAALTRFARPNETTSAESLDRLARFLLARLRPRFEPAELRYDDTMSQTEALESDTLQFRRRMHWVMGLGAAGLLSWLVLLVVVGTMRTRQRTHALIEDLSGDEIEPRTRSHKPLAGGASVLVPLVIAVVTIAAFFLGVILMLAAM